MRQLGLAGGSILVITLLAAWLINRDMTSSLGALKSAMDRLAKGELTAAVPGTNRRDEIGGMAATVLVFKDSMAETERLRTEQDAVRQRAADEHKDSLNSLADGFERQIGRLAASLSARSTELESTAHHRRGGRGAGRGHRRDRPQCPADQRRGAGGDRRHRRRQPGGGRDRCGSVQLPDRRRGSIEAGGQLSGEVGSFLAGVRAA